MLAAVPGLTYRQLNTWTHKGWLRAHERQRKSSGSDFVWELGEDRIARTMVKLIRAGLTPAKAAEAARIIHDSPFPPIKPVRLSPVVTITLEGEVL
jgi:hypothetical protein